MEDNNTDRSDHWFYCKDCHTRLAPVCVHQGRTVIPIHLFGVVAYIDRTVIHCPTCGRWRRFLSLPVEGAG